MSYRILFGDCITEMAELADSSVDAIVTDPPYGLEFMGKDWDAPWQESDINADAGMVATGYTDGGNRLDRPTFTGSTNPKCQACKGTRRGRRDGTAVVAVCLCADGGRFPNVRAVEMRALQDWCEQWATQALRVLKPGGHLLAFGGTRTYHRLACAVEDAGFEIRDSIMWIYGSGFPKSLDISKAIDKAAGATREVVGRKTGRAATPIRDIRGGGLIDDRPNTYDASAITAPATDAAREFEGWGTALKPAHEPIVVARKPLIGTVAANVLAHGTGGVNVDACRIEPEEGFDSQRNARGGENGLSGESTFKIRERRAEDQAVREGRWPANVVLDEAAGAELDAQTGTLTSGKAAVGGHKRNGDKFRATYGAFPGQEVEAGAAIYGDSGGASRFFYCAKATTKERPVGPDGTKHPTVKPLALMRWLVRLVTPPGGTVLDPFAGSGTTVEAAILENFDVIGIEMTAEFLPLIAARIRRAQA